MKTIRTKINRVNVVGEIFDNANELIRTMGARPHVFDNCDFFKDDYVCRKSEFYGFETSKQLKADFLSSKVDTRSLEKLKMAVHPKGGVKNKIKFYNNVQGFAPIVPLALIGVPNSMIDQRLTPIKNKIVNLNVCVSAHCGYTIEELAEGGKLIFQTILGLEQSGYRVNFTAYCGFDMGYDLAYIGLKIKDSCQPMDIARCAYPFINPSFFRGIGFGWYQRTDGFKHSYGYGRPIYEGNNSFEKSLAGQKNAIFLYLSEILKGGESVIKDALANNPDTSSYTMA